MRSGFSSTQVRNSRFVTRLYASARRTNDVPSGGTGAFTRRVGYASDGAFGGSVPLIHETKATSQPARFSASASRSALRTGFGRYGSVWRRNTAFRTPTPRQRADLS